MFISRLKRLMPYIALLLLFILAGCNTQENTNSTTGNANLPVSSPTQSRQPLETTATVPPHSVPIIILSPTPVSGGNPNSQMITLPDRTIILNNISKQPGADVNSTAIVLAITIKNTGTKSIMNEVSFFQLISAEGDTFGLQSNTTTSFFGTIASNSSRNGTVIFQIPTAAVNGLRLLYRSEIATETVFISLNV